MRLPLLTLLSLCTSLISAAALPGSGGGSSPTPLCAATSTYNQRLMCCENLVEPANVLTLTKNPLPIVAIVEFLLLGFRGIGMGTQCYKVNKPSDCDKGEKSICCGNIALLDDVFVLGCETQIFNK